MLQQSTANNRDNKKRRFSGWWWLAGAILLAGLVPLRIVAQEPAPEPPEAPEAMAAAEAAEVPEAPEVAEATEMEAPEAAEVPEAPEAAEPAEAPEAPPAPPAMAGGVAGGVAPRAAEMPRPGRWRSRPSRLFRPPRRGADSAPRPAPRALPAVGATPCRLQPLSRRWRPAPTPRRTSTRRPRPRPRRLLPRRRFHPRGRTNFLTAIRAMTTATPGFAAGNGSASMSGNMEDLDKLKKMRGSSRRRSSGTATRARPTWCATPPP